MGTPGSVGRAQSSLRGTYGSVGASTELSIGGISGSVGAGPEICSRHTWKCWVGTELSGGRGEVHLIALGQEAHGYCLGCCKAYYRDMYTC
jgi:hypothetical protein